MNSLRHTRFNDIRFILHSTAACIFFIISTSNAPAQSLTGDEILQKVDQTLITDSKIILSKMIVHGRRESRTIEAKSWQRGASESFTEYLAPAREKGTKMLKLNNMLWTYSPSTDRIIMISQHMLRQSVMGSDLSYEDMMEDPRLPNIYSASVTAEDTLLGRNCWVLALTAKKEDVAYFSRKIWVDQGRFIVLREHLFAKSGKLLKTVDVTDVMNVKNRWFIRSALYKDVMKEGKGTEFFIDAIEFNVAIPDHVFTKASLRR